LHILFNLLTFAILFEKPMAETAAILRNCPTSPRKMRYVADLIRGMDAEKALNILKYSSKHASEDLEKLLLSAINNWQAKNEGARVEDNQLYVKTIFVDGGRMIKRWLPAPHGRAFKKRKRSNHVTLIVDSRTTVAAAPEESATAPEKKVEHKPKAVKKSAKKSPAKKSAKKTTAKA
jgi:large subunit ribosomal protein L22